MSSFSFVWEMTYFALIARKKVVSPWRTGCRLSFSSQPPRACRDEVSWRAHALLHLSVPIPLAPAEIPLAPFSLSRFNSPSGPIRVVIILLLLFSFRFATLLLLSKLPVSPFVALSPRLAAFSLLFFSCLLSVLALPSTFLLVFLHPVTLVFSRRLVSP